MQRNHNTIAWSVVGLIALVGIAFWGYVAANWPQDEAREAAPSSYTMAEVAAASTTAKCWTAIEGGVYDFTPFVAQQPGVVTLCGTNATEAVNRLGESSVESFSSLRIGSLRD